MPRVARGGWRSRSRGFLGWGQNDPNAPPPDSRRGALIGLLITALLVIGGVYLVHVLRNTAQLQDCVMSGRTNCAPLNP